MRQHNVTARLRPVVVDEVLDHLTMPIDVSKNDSLSNKVFFGCVMSALDPGLSYTAPEYFNSDLVNCDLRRLTYDRSVLQDLTFVNCDLTGAELARTLLERVSFIDCDLTKINFTGSFLRDVEIKRSTITGAIFTRAYIDSLHHDADPEVLNSTLLRNCANFPGPLPAPYVHAPGYPYPAGPFVGTPGTPPVPMVCFSEPWAMTLAEACGLSLHTIATLLAEHPELSPRAISSLATALSVKS